MMQIWGYRWAKHKLQNFTKQFNFLERVASWLPETPVELCFAQECSFYSPSTTCYHYLEASVTLMKSALQ